MALVGGSLNIHEMRQQLFRRVYCGVVWWCWGWASNYRVTFKRQIRKKKRMRKGAGKGTEESWEKSEDGLKRLLNKIIQNQVLRKFRAVTG